MKKLKKVLKVTGIILGIIVICSITFVHFNSKIGNSTIKANIEGLGTELIGVSWNSIDKTEKGFKFGFSINNKINIKIPISKECEISIRTAAEIYHRTTFRSRRIKGT